MFTKKLKSKFEVLKVKTKTRWTNIGKPILLNSITVGLSSLALMLVLGLFGFDYTLKNYISSIALYFIIEELKGYFNL